MISSCLSKIFNLKALRIVFDLIFFVLTGLIYVAVSYQLDFPSLRAYMIAGVLLGILLYCKSFGIILANVGKKIYNKINKKLKSAKARSLRKGR